MGVQRKAFDPQASRSGYPYVAVPTSERAALLAAGEIPDPYVGTNNERTLWHEEKEWWFIREFTLPESTKGRSIDLVFEGIVYQGEAWINGKPLGRMEGMFNPFSFDVARHLKHGGKNVLAVRLEAPRDAQERNLGGRGCGPDVRWFVLASAGPHPACPGDGRYEVFTPLFDKVVLRTVKPYASGRPFTVVARNNAPDPRYIQKATLDGRPLERCWITHEELAKGGTLVLDLGPEPSAWGRN